MRPSILSPLEHFWLPEIFTTFEILATGIQPYSTAQQMHPHGSSPGFRISRRQPKTKRNERKKTTIGQFPTHRKRTVWDVAANVTRTSETSKVKREVVCRSGSRSPEVGLRLNSSMALFSL